MKKILLAFMLIILCFILAGCRTPVHFPRVEVQPTEWTMDGIRIGLPEGWDFNYGHLYDFVGNDLVIHCVSK